MELIYAGGMTTEQLGKRLGGEVVKFAEGNGVRIKVPSVARGLVETSPKPVGDPKCYWTMVLRRRPGKCQLPRGFVKGNKPVFV